MLTTNDAFLFPFVNEEARGTRLVLNENEAAELLSARCEQGQPHLVRALLDAGADVNAYDTEGYFPLYSAAAYGRVRIVRLLLDAGANVGRASRSEAFTALHAAACHGHLSTLQALIDAGADINALSRHRSTPVMMAAGGGHPEIIGILIDAGADLNVQDRGNGTTVLLHACAQGKTEIARLALEAGADTNIRTFTDMNALDVACMYGQLESVTLLLDHHAAVHIPLHLASAAGHIEVCRQLVEHEIDIESEAHHGMTPLTAVCCFSRPEAVKFLLECGANPSNAGGCWTPVMAASEAGSLECVKLLVEAGADINWRSSKGDYALAVARREGHWEIEQYLKAYGSIDYHAEQQRRDLGVFEAVLSDDLDCLEALLGLGACIHKADEQGLTPLILAAERGYGAIVRVLLEAGADINAVCRSTGETALGLAAKNGHLDAVKSLAASGANLNTRNRSGHTPTAAAAFHGHITVVQFLIEAGAVVDSRVLFGAIASSNEEIVELVVNAGVDLYGVDEVTGLTPLLRAIRDGNTGIVEMLLLSGASANTRSTEGLTPLAAAVQLGRPDIIDLLTQGGADVEYDREALIQASVAGRAKIVDQLLRAGARPETKALIRASEEGHADVVRVLLAAGADQNARTKHGHTALARASALGHRQVAEILTQSARGNHTNDGRAVHTSKAPRSRVGRGLNC